MQGVTKQNRVIIIFFKGIRLLFIPLSLIMFYLAAKAWGDMIAFVLAVAFGGTYFFIVNDAITDIIGSNIKAGIEKLIGRITKSPVHVEFGRAWGKLSFLIFLQDDNKIVTKVIYTKLVEILKNSEYFHKIEIVSMANVPNLEKETIKSFKATMLKHAFEVKRNKEER